MVEFLAALFLFLAVALGAVALFAPRRRTAGEARLRELRPPTLAEQPPSATLKRSRSSIPTLQRRLSNSDWADSTALELERAHIQLRVGEFLLVRVAFALAAFGIVALILRFGVLGIVFGLAAAGIAFMVPPFYVRLIQRRRAKQIERQLIDFLPALASSLRAGFAFQQGIETSLPQIGAPLSDELELLLNDLNLGGTMQDALLDMGRRVGSTDVDMLVTAILVQRTTGGNLTEVLDQVAETLRERERILGDIQTFTAQQRLTGLILSVYPIAIGLLLFTILPDMWGKMFTETLGNVLLGIALGLQILGFFAIRRALEIEI